MIQTCMNVLMVLESMLVIKSLATDTTHIRFLKEEQLNSL